MTIDILANQVRFASATSSSSPRSSTASSPTTRASFRPAHKNRIDARSRDALRQSLQRAAILSNEKFRGVRLVLDRRTPADHLHQHRAGRSRGGARGRLRGDALDIGFNVNYLLDVLNNVGAGACRARVRRRQLERAGARCPAATTSSTSSCRCASSDASDTGTAWQPQSARATAAAVRLRLGQHQGPEGPGSGAQAPGHVHRRHLRRHRPAPHGVRGGRQRGRRGARRLLRRDQGHHPHRQLDLGASTTAAASRPASRTTTSSSAPPPRS